MKRSFAGALGLSLFTLASCTCDGAVTARRAAPDAGRPADAAPAPTAISTKGKPAVAPPAGGAPLGPPGPSTVRSTNGAIYVANLKSRGRVLEQLLEGGKDPVGAATNLAAWHLELMNLDGDLGHLTTAEKLLRDATGQTKDATKLRKARMQLAGVVAERHGFAEAKAIYESVLADHPDDPGALAGLASARRNLGEIAGDARPPIAPKTYAEWGEVAISEFLGGRVEAADLALRHALGAYPDVHPIPLAWIDLQRGLLRLRTGRYAEARDFFATAYARLPEYYVVAEHLAETEALLGNYARALELYDAVIAATHLPEFMAARAGVLVELGRHEEAKAQLEAADQAWRALLAKHGVALAAHAIEFFLADRPDLPFAREWADRNLTVRRDPTSLLLAAQAHAATGDVAGARALIDEASRRPVRTDEFFVHLADAYRLIGDLGSARMAHGQAVALNPKTPPLADAP